MIMNDKLKNVLLNANKNVPYYRDLFFKNNIDITNMSELSSFQRIPLLDKEAITNNFSNFISEAYDSSELSYEYTSGSTGIPLKIAKSHKDRVMQGQIMWKNRISTYDITPDSPYCTWHIKGPSIYAYKNRLQFSCVKLEDECLRQYAEAIIEHKPEWLFGGAETWFVLAEYMENNGYKAPKSIRFIESTGEQLRPETAKFLSDYFECPVDNLYGCIEMYGIARSTNGTKLRIMENNVYLEIVDENGKVKPEGQFGNIVLTSMNNDAMPFIRYKIGDVGRVLNGTSSEGKYKYLELKRTRVNERINIGTKIDIDADIFHCAIERLNRSPDYAILQYKIYQKAVREFDVYIRLKEGGDGITERVKMDYLKEIEIYGLGNCDWKIEFVDRITLDEMTGKYQYFVRLEDK